MPYSFELIRKPFDNKQRDLLADMLEKQNKVRGNLKNKIDRCELLCIAKDNDVVIGIGAIKKKTESDFDTDRANLPKIADQFEWELGYIYTVDNYQGKGIASEIVRRILVEFGKSNLIATTEIKENPSMVKILEKYSFCQKGKTWTSSIHNNQLGLFIYYGNNFSR